MKKTIKIIILLIHKKIEIKATIETNNKPMNKIINKTFDNRYNSQNKHIFLNHEAKSNNNNLEKTYYDNHIKKQRYNILGNTSDIINCINYHKIIDSYDINKNNTNTKINPSYINNIMENNNIFNINNTFNIYNQNY